MSNYTGVNVDDDINTAQAAVNGSQAAVQAVTVGASPFTYTFASKGALNVIGGTVSQIAIVRNGVSTNIGGVVGNFHASKGDKITVTYSVAPTAVFIPY